MTVSVQPSASVKVERFGAKAEQHSALRQMLPALAVIAAMTIVRAVVAGQFDLRTDEAYYWTWSKENVLSFLDHPPMIAWFIRLGALLFGDTNFGARFCGLLAMLVTQMLLADIVWRVTRDVRAVIFVVLMMEASIYFGLLMTKLSPDIALTPFAVAMMWALVRLTESNDERWWLAAGGFGGLALLSKFTVVLLVPAIIAFALVPAWRGRWLRSPFPWAGALIAAIIFLPVLIWNIRHDWASFRFQGVRVIADHDWSLRTVGEFIGSQFCLVGFVLLPVVLTGTAITAWRGFRHREPVAVLLSTAVFFPFLYFLWKSTGLRVGDTWLTFIWPFGFAAASINLALMEKEGWRPAFIDLSVRWVKIAIVSGIAAIILAVIYYGATSFNLVGRRDPIGGEANFGPLAEQVETEVQAIGATWIVTTDYRTYAMLRWFLRDRWPVIQVNERGRYLGFRPSDMSLIEGRTGLYVGRVPQNNPDTLLWKDIPANREPFKRVDRVWRGYVMDTYSLERFTGWTPELVPPTGSPLFRWLPLAGKVP